MNTSKKFRFFLITWLICTVWASITVISTLNIYIIVFYGIILFRGCSNLFTLKTHTISMRLLPIITFFSIWPIINLIYLVAYLYLLNSHWPCQRKKLLTRDDSEIIYEIEPVLPIPFHLKKFWKKIYIIKNGTSYTLQEFSGPKLKNTYQIAKMCCPDSIEQNIYEEAVKTQRIEIHLSEHDGSLLKFSLYEEDMIPVQNRLNNIIKKSCDAEGTKRIFTAK